MCLHDACQFCLHIVCGCVRWARLALLSDACHVLFAYYSDAVCLCLSFVVCLCPSLSVVVCICWSVFVCLCLPLSSIVHKLPHCGFMSLSKVVVRLCPSLSDRCLSSSGLLCRTMLEEVYVVIRLDCSLERCWTSLCSRGVSYQRLALSADDVATCVVILV